MQAVIIKILNLTTLPGYLAAGNTGHHAWSSFSGDGAKALAELAAGLE